MTHLYEFFGVLLGCSLQNSTAFPSYSGEASMYSVHEFMALDYAQVGYFIEQVGLAATSFGVSTDDAGSVGTALYNLFALRCAPAVTVVEEQGSALQAICIDVSP